MQAELIDFMGSDDRVVDAARVSFHKIAENYTQEQNVKLIQYLANHGHFTPFTHVQITLREKVPIFVARQRFKHMVGFTYNEMSRRYVDDEPEFYWPEPLRNRPEGSIKQGSEGIHPKDEHYRARTVALCELARRLYNQMIADGVAPEQARAFLPQNTYTEYYCTGSLAAWARAYKLRIDPHAQKEIQDLAKEWMRLIGGISELQHSWKALTNETS